ncbi:MAG TPA: RNA polymerase-binding protein DksA [Burkholderiaceae bacterium]
MNKTTAKRATPAKTAAKKPAAKTAARPTAKPAAKSAAPKAAASKSAPAKKAAAVKAASAKTLHKPAAKAAHPKPAGKSAPPPAKAVHHAPAPKAPSKSPVHAPAAHKPHSKPAHAPAAAVPAASAPAVPAAPQANRFADRFSPAKPPTRTMNHVITETPKPAHKADPRLVNAWKTKAGRELTEDELLAMPDSEYMNEKQLDFFRAKLTALKDDLLSNAGETTEHLREDTSIVPDPADRATIEEEHALELRTRDRERKLLKKIGQSLARIDAGDYGFCDETGEPIGLGRLIARPTATLSLEAQQRRELKQKMFGD